MAMEQAHAQYLGGDQGAVALEDSYQDEAYDYEGYDDGSAGVIDPNTGLPYAGSDGNKGQFHYNRVHKNGNTDNLAEQFFAIKDFQDAIFAQ